MTVKKSRAGRPEKWGEPTSPYAVRWPASHLRLYEQLAAQQGIGVGEYLIRMLAEAHGLEVQPRQDEHQQELLLSA